MSINRIPIARFSSAFFLMVLMLPLGLFSQSRSSAGNDPAVKWPPEVFPNPTHGPLSLDLGATYEDVNIRLWSSKGEQIHQEYHRSARYIGFEIPGPAGDYVLEINTAVTKTVKLRVTKED
jgi:hypothetical protein